MWKIPKEIPYILGGVAMRFNVALGFVVAGLLILLPVVLDYFE